LTARLRATDAAFEDRANACRCVPVNSPRKRAGMSSLPRVPRMRRGRLWAIDFQFDSTIDGKAVRIASMLDEHARVSLLQVVER
jgi:putative transposase